MVCGAVEYLSDIILCSLYLAVIQQCAGNAGIVDLLSSPTVQGLPTLE